MNTTNDKINKAIRKQLLKKVMLISLVLIAFIFIVGLVYLGNSSSPEGQEVVAKIESIGINQGADGSIVYIVCVLPDGSRTNVFMHEKRSIKKGDQVVLLAFDKFIGGKKYQFLRKKK